MKTREEIITDINSRVAEEFEIDEAVITPDARIFDTLDLDSISLVDLVAIVQVNYGIMIQKEELASIVTFNDLYNYIEARQK